MIEHTLKSSISNHLLSAVIMIAVFFAAGLHDINLVYIPIISICSLVIILKTIKSINISALLYIIVFSSTLSTLIIQFALFNRDYSEILSKGSFLIFSLIFLSMVASVIIPARLQIPDKFNFALSKIIRMQYKFHVTNESEIDKLEMPNNRLQAIKSLINRGRRLKMINLCLLFLILTILICAASFVVFAGQIAGSDSQSSDSLVILTKAVDTQKELVHSLEKELEDTEIKLLQPKNNSLNDQATKNKPPQSKSPDNSSDEISVHESILKDQLTREKNELTRLQLLLNKIQDGLTEQTNGKNEKTSNYILATASISRFGVLVITIYLVQILVSLYRYNAQLAANYYCQSDALLLLDHDNEIISKMISSLKNQVGFYKNDSTIIEKLVEKGSEIFSKK